MNTTEWVRRYNRVFEYAGNKSEPSGEYTLMKGDPVRVSGKTYFRHIEVPKGRLYPYGGFEYYMFSPDAIPSNPSHFEPKEVVDDTPRGDNGLNQKEYTSIDRFNVVGRGRGFLIKIPAESDLPKIDEVVVIDGAQEKVASIDRMMYLTYPTRPSPDVTIFVYG